MEEETGVEPNPDDSSYCLNETPEIRERIRTGLRGFAAAAKRRK